MKNIRSKRIEWIDIFKGICILLMVIAHTYNPFISYIYAFHMAAFLFISGYSSDYNKLSLINYLKNKFKTLMIPFLIINILYLLLGISFDFFGIYDNLFIAEFTSEGFMNLFKYWWSSDFAGATWFLVVLFLSSIGTKILNELIPGIEKNDHNKRLVISTIFMFIFYILFGKTNESLLYYLDVIPLAIFFITLGNYLKNVKIELPKMTKFFLEITAIITYFVFILFSYTHIEWVVRSFINPITLTVVSCGGFLIVYYLSKLFCKIMLLKKIFIYLGKNTLSIILYHFIAFKIFYVILYLLNIVDKEQLKELVPKYESFFLNMLTVVFAIMLSLIINYIVNILKKKINIEKLLNTKTIAITIIIGTTLFFGSWTITNNLYFMHDDWNNLVKLPYQSYSELFTLFPTDVYLSRPIGWLIAKFSYDIFGMNYTGHAVIMLIIHTFNAIMLYFISMNLLENHKDKNIISIISTVIFSCYPITLLASFWQAGMFDLAGTTLIFISILSFQHLLKENITLVKKIIYSIIMITSYYFSLRSKEMFIALPAILIAYSYLKKLTKSNISINRQIKKYDYKEFIKKNIPVILMLIVMITYFLYTRILNSSSDITNNLNDPYFYSFNPISMIKSLYIYLLSYFNPESIVFGNITDIIKFDGDYIIAIVLISIYFIIMIFKESIKKDHILLILMLFFLGLIAPVLPMINMQQQLYLYAPGAFLAIFISVIVFKYIRIVTNKNLIPLFIVFVGLYTINTSDYVANFRDFWTGCALKDKVTYEMFNELKNDYEGIEKIYFLNVQKNEYNSLSIGKGHVIRVAFENPNLKVYINENDYEFKENTIIFDYENNKIIKE